MTKITLHRLILQNFKGFTFLLDAGDYDTNVYGANATGKTTLADAVSWLLFDKDSLGRSDFEIKNLDAMGNEEHGLDHSVEGLFTVNGEYNLPEKDLP
jgi:ATPase involved in DNA repair